MQAVKIKKNGKSKEQESQYLQMFVIHERSQELSGALKIKQRVSMFKNRNKEVTYPFCENSRQKDSEDEGERSSARRRTKGKEQGQARPDQVCVESCQLLSQRNKECLVEGKRKTRVV